MTDYPKSEFPDLRLHNLTVEFWNRRRHPIALRYVRADISGVDILDVSSTLQAPRSFTRKNCIYTEPNLVVGPQASSEIELAITFKDQSLDALRPLFNIEVAYFDPRTNKEEKLQFSYKAFYPEMGWRKTESERSEFMKAYDVLREDYDARRENAEAKVLLQAVLKDPSFPESAPRAKRRKPKVPKGAGEE